VKSSESSTPSLGGVGSELRIGLRLSAVASGDEATEEVGVRPSSLSS
jgi:hypothetical protein